MFEHLRKLGQRKMAQWALAYAAGAWVALQVLGLAADSYGWSPTVMRIAFGIAVVGFIITLVLAWYHGERGQQKTTGAELLILAAVLAVGGGLVWNFERQRGSAHKPGAVAAASAATATSTGTAAESEPAIHPRSIAVLPFANLSADKDNAYFAEGIQDEILTRLSKIADLKVISRTSTQRYASKPDNLSAIARELGVANIVEGSVQKFGNKVRINVQLIRADTDSHLWAEIYDRELVDIFSIQSEVTTAIAAALQATLTAEEQRGVNAKPTSNTAAYEAYLRAVTLDNASVFEPETALKSLALYREAVRLDPDFAEAWRRLVQTASLLYTNHFPSSTPADLATIEEAAATVARLKPDSGDAWLAQGYYRYRGLRDLPGALAAFAKAAERQPNNADALAAMAYVERRQGDLASALLHLTQAEQLDPGNGNLSATKGEMLSALRRFPEARIAYDRGLRLEPGDIELQLDKVNTHVAEGDLASARRLLDALPGKTADPRVRTAYAELDWLSGQTDALARLCTELTRELKGGGDIDTFKRVGCELANADARRLQGKSAEVQAHCQSAMTLLEGVDNPAMFVRERAIRFRGVVHACLGRRVESVRDLTQAVQWLNGDAKETPAAELSLARAHALLGDHDAALAILKRSLVVPYGTTPALLRMSPIWTPLRKDPRFQALLHSP